MKNFFPFRSKKHGVRASYPFQDNGSFVKGNSQMEAESLNWPIAWEQNHLGLSSYEDEPFEQRFFPGDIIPQIDNTSDSPSIANDTPTITSYPTPYQYQVPQLLTPPWQSVFTKWHITDNISWGGGANSYGMFDTKGQLSGSGSFREVGKFTGQMLTGTASLNQTNADIFASTGERGVLQRVNGSSIRKLQVKHNMSGIKTYIFQLRASVRGNLEAWNANWNSPGTPTQQQVIISNWLSFEYLSGGIPSVEIYDMNGKLLTTFSSGVSRPSSSYDYQMYKEFASQPHNRTSFSFGNPSPVSRTYVVKASSDFTVTNDFGWLVRLYGQWRAIRMSLQYSSPQLLQK